MKMEPIVSSETSAIRTQTPGNYPKRNNLQINPYLKCAKMRCGIPNAYILDKTMYKMPVSFYSYCIIGIPKNKTTHVFHT